MSYKPNFATIDGNTAAAYVAYAFSEVAAIYPITPSSPMGELADEWSVEKQENIFGEPVKVVEMQSEAGASGAIHGSLTGGALTTTFTSSQGLMLMLPNMYKIAGELLPGVFHVAARSLACQSLSIFADHSDVMAGRGTGFALISSSSVQEVIDLGVVSHLSAIEASIPFLHFFDGFRTSHEIQKVDQPGYELFQSLFPQQALKKFRKRAIRPEAPICKVGAQNPDVFFQGREAVNTYYDNLREIVKNNMEKFGEKTGRHYRFFDYSGDPEAESVIVIMGSAGETVVETVRYLNRQGEKTGVVKVRLYRPFFADDFMESLPKTVKRIAVMDRTKEPGSVGEPLFLDVYKAAGDSGIRVIGGRYGLSSKVFSPEMIRAVFDHLKNDGFHGFTVGIDDDVTHTSLSVKEPLDTCPGDIIRCKFWGFGSDGTVSANKNSIKLIGENTDLNVQGYFEYDAKKSGGYTISHLRFGKSDIKSEYKVLNADFIALHNHSYIGVYDILEGVNKNGVFLLNSPWPPEEVFENLTRDMQQTIIDKKLQLYTIDAHKIAKKHDMGRKINTIMQTAFFKLTDIIDFNEALALIKKDIEKTYGKKGEGIVEKNMACVEDAKNAVSRVKVPDKIPADYKKVAEHIDSDNPFVENVVKPVMKLKGSEIPVSRIPGDGVIPTGTTALEKRRIAMEVPRWLPDKCIQCAQCSFFCPHATIRVKQIDPRDLKKAPETFVTAEARGKTDRELRFRVQVFVEDCTGCGNCINICPANALEWASLKEETEGDQIQNARFFSQLPHQREGVKEGTLKWSQLRPHYFEFPGACAGCGETPYVRLITQIFGDRMVIANATGCSSIFGGTFPFIPYCTDERGYGPAWANSLFEDNAEYGFGMRLAMDAIRRQLKTHLEKITENSVSEKMLKTVREMLSVWNETDDNARQIRSRLIRDLEEEIKKNDFKKRRAFQHVLEYQDYLADKSVWIVGGDGWAYDIGFGGLDHVLAQGKNVNVLVLDNELYSNTGGQSSKATPLCSVAKFAASGKTLPKKNLGLMMATYGYVYVGQINMGAKASHAVQTLIEAENYDGPSLVIAYSPCIEHGVSLANTKELAKKATDSGYWPLFRYNPDLKREGKNPFLIDSGEPKIEFEEYALQENRYSRLKKNDPEKFEELTDKAQEAMKERDRFMEKLVEEEETTE